MDEDWVYVVLTMLCSGAVQDMLQVQCTLGGEGGARLGRNDHRSIVDITQFTKKDYSTGPR